MKTLIFVLMYAFSFVPGQDTEEPGEMGRSYKKGTIINHSSGDGGCGWMLEIEGKLFKPKNLSKAFKKDSLVVKLDYETSMTIFKCDQLKGGAQEIYINWMEKSN